MADREWDESWSEQCADLPAECRRCAKEAVGLLRQVITPRAQALAREGFIVPSPESIQYAAEVFDAVAARPGGEHWLQRPDPQASVDVICALANAVDGLEREWDMDAFDAWWTWRDANKTVRQAMGVRTMVNGGAMVRVVKLLVDDIARAEREYGANR